MTTRTPEDIRRNGAPYANLTGANLTYANLTGANLTGAYLSGANLAECSGLRHANLHGANLTYANLTGANLTGANLTGANLTGANLTGANLSGANLAECSGLRHASIGWSGHGECGRTLLGVVIDGDIRLFCGCFRGTVRDLEEYIAKAGSPLAPSRTLALTVVTALLLFDN